MNKKNFNLKALFLVTLFLLSFSAQENFAQQSNPFFAQKFVKSNRQIAADFNFNAAKNFDVAEKSTEEFAPRKSSSLVKKQSGSYTRPDASERFKKYAGRTFGGYALLGTVASAGFAHLIDSPPEWEDDSRGFARRVGSAFGKTVVEETTVYALDEAFKLDSNFYRSGKKDFGSRLKNAFLTTFTARKANGKRVIGAPRIVGAFTSNIVAAEVWFPNNYDYRDGLRYGATSLGVNVLVNLFREFFPR